MPAKTRRTPRAPQKRSVATRERLIKATIDISVERGYAGLTVADVAKRAGVSSGARVHHYRTKDDLVVAANQFAYDEAISLGTQRSVHAGTSPTPLKELAADLTSLYFGRFFKGSLDAVVAARTDPALARRLHPIIAHYHASMRDVWTKALRKAGYSAANAEKAYDIILGIVRGMGLTETWRPDDKAHRQLIRHVERMVEATVPKG